VEPRDAKSGRRPHRIADGQIAKVLKGAHCSWRNRWGWCLENRRRPRNTSNLVRDRPASNHEPAVGFPRAKSGRVGIKARQSGFGADGTCSDFRGHRERLECRFLSSIWAAHCDPPSNDFCKQHARFIHMESDRFWLTVLELTRGIKPLASRTVK
jgi:hypothetical protein